MQSSAIVTTDSLAEFVRILLLHYLFFHCFFFIFLFFFIRMDSPMRNQDCPSQDNYWRNHHRPCQANGEMVRALPGAVLEGDRRE